MKSTIPELRVRDGVRGDLRCRIDGILCGFAKILQERDNHIDIITTSLARREILELIVAVSKDVKMLKVVKEELKFNKSLSYINEIIQTVDGNVN